MSVAVIVPTYRAATYLPKLLSALLEQTSPPDEIIVIDSSSPDDTAEIVRRFGATLIEIEREKFNHGLTRTEAARRTKVDFLVFLTQDALPAQKDTLERLLTPFDDSQIAASYGRQIAPPGAHPLARLHRLFNYPPVSRVFSYEDRKKLGLRAAFFSNSFSCFRRQKLAEIGYFPPVPCAEDVWAAAKLLMKGYRIAYVAEAQVFHAHHLSWHEEWKRYFRLGLFHAREEWLLRNFGRPEGEGWRLLVFGTRFLRSEDLRLLPSFWLRLFWRWLAYRSGFFYHKIQSFKTD